VAVPRQWGRPLTQPPRPFYLPLNGTLFALSLSLIAAAPAKPPTVGDAALAYNEGRLLESMDKALQILEKKPDGAAPQEALRLLWQAAYDLKQSRRFTPRDPEWQEAVQRSRKSMARRQKTAQDVLQRLEDLSKNLEKQETALFALRAVTPDLAALRSDAGDEWARFEVERQVADIRRKLEALAASPFPNPADLHEVNGHGAFYAGDLRRAVEEWKLALSLNPDNDALNTRLAAAAQSLEAEQTRAQAAARLQEGVSAFEDRNYDEAVEALKQTLALDAGSAEARRYLSLAQKARQERDRDQKIAALLARGKKQETSGDLLGAIQIWVDVLTLAPAHAEARASLRAARARLRQTESPPPPTAPVDPAAAAKAKEAYTLGLKQYTDGNLRAAEASFLEALRWQPDFEKVREALEQLRKEIAPK